MSGVGLQIDPTELTFRFELRKIIPVTLSLHNPTGDRIAFKVKTTNPKKYCVRPSSGVVEPETTRDVQVIMQAQREYPANMADCKDKFLVQWATMPPHVQEVTADIFDTTINRDVRQARLRVNLVGPPKPPSPVPEGTEEEASPVKDVFKDSNAKPGGFGGSGPLTSDERNRLQQQLARAEKEKSEYARRLQSYQSGPAKSGGQIMQGGIGLVHLILAVVLAFVIGRFL